MLNQVEENYEKFADFKNHLLKLLKEGVGDFSSLGMVKEHHSTQLLVDRVGNDSFKVMIMGNFNTGKSTLINSFLNENVLPTSILPCTAVINEIKYAQHPSAIVHYKNPLPADLPEN